MRSFIISLVLFCGSIYAMAQKSEVRLWGNAPDYANINLIIEYTSNFITHNKSELKRFLVSKNGDFDVTFEIEQITPISINLGKINGVLLVIPGDNYQIQLPPFSPLNPEDKLNPFFIPEDTYLGILNNDPGHLNEQVQLFDAMFNEEFNKHVQQIVIGRKSYLIKQIISELNEKFPSENEWFNNYKHFSYQTLTSLKNQNNLKSNTQDYFFNHPIAYQTPSYWEAFNTSYKNFFYKYMSSAPTDSLKQQIIQRGNFPELCKALQYDTLYRQQDFAELVLLRGIYDAFYSQNYQNSYLFALLQQAIHNCHTQINKDIAKDILNKIDKLRPGTEAPNFVLPTLNGKERELKDYQGKFVYLNFATTQNYACKKDFQVLDQISQEYKKDLRVITILTDDDVDAAEHYISKNKYNWIILSYNQNGKVLLDYDIKGYPTYYLIDPEGKLILSPSPSPEENFIDIFSETYNNYRHKELRKNKSKARTIYDM